MKDAKKGTASGSKNTPDASMKNPSTDEYATNKTAENADNASGACRRFESDTCS